MQSGLRLFLSLLLIAISGVAVLAEEDVHTTSLEMKRGVPYVRLMINGRGPYLFAVDTGTGNEAVVSPKLAAELALPVVGEALLTDLSNRTHTPVDKVEMDRVTVAGMDFNGVTAIVRKPVDYNGKCMGLLGFAFFREVLLTLDYPKRRLELSRSVLKDEEGVMPMRLHKGSPMVELSMGKQRIDAQIDTAGLGLTLPLWVGPSLDFITGTDVKGSERTVVAEYTLRGGQLNGAIGIGDYHYDAPYVEVNPTFPIANIGSVALQNFVMSFDQRSGLERITASRDWLTVSPSPMMVSTGPDPFAFIRMQADKGGM